MTHAPDLLSALRHVSSPSFSVNFVRGKVSGCTHRHDFPAHFLDDWLTCAVGWGDNAADTISMELNDGRVTFKKSDFSLNIER